MEFIVNKSDLVRALSVVESVSSKKTTMPILYNALFEVLDDQTLQITGSDISISAVIKVSAQVKKTGRTTVSSKVISGIVRELPDAPVTVKLKENERIEITCNDASVKLNGVPASGYPELPGLDQQTDSSIEARALQEMFFKTVYSSSTDEARYNLNGVCLESTKKGKGHLLQVVATDGFRLALCSKILKNINFEGRVIIPRKGISELKKILPDKEDVMANFAITQQHFIVECEGCKMVVGLADAEFPEYDNAIPKERGDIFLIPVNEFTQALRRCSLLVSDVGKAVKLIFLKNQLKITGSTPTLGEAEETIAIDYDGEEKRVGYNATFLLDFLATADLSGQIELSIENNSDLMTLTIPGDDAYTSIIMPMRV